MAGLVLLGTLLLYYFIRSDKQSLTVQPENRFIQETEQLLAELSQGNKVTPQSLGLSSEYTQTDPFVADSSAKKLSSPESQKEIPQVFTVPHQVNLTSEPQWEKELDLFLKGEGSAKGFLDSLSTINWKQARDALALAYEEKKLPQSKNFQEKFWMKVGEVGGATVAEELLKEGDPAFTKILKGWAKGSPQEMFDYYADLDLKSPEVQNYLEKTNSREIPLMDQFSSGVIDEILRNSDGKIGNLQVENANDLIDHFLEKDKRKAESLTREFTERVIKGRDKDTLKQWVAGYKEPELQAGTAQRVIESGVFDKNPLEAVEFANSLESTKAKRSALSSAYARLAGGVNGHDPNITATELNAMQDGWQRDFALNGFAHGLVRRDPDAAIQWANSISNEGFREVVTKNITKRINAEVLPRLNAQGVNQN
ncbi:MAG: hypothetical protein ACJZ7A_00025 [Opitutales bacterium]